MIFSENRFALFRIMPGSPYRPAEIVDVARRLGRKQPRRRGPVEAALAFGFVLAVGAMTLFGESVVHAVDDQHGVIALERVGVLALLGGAESAFHQLARHVVVAAGLPVALL